MHADRDAAGLADPQAPGNSAGRTARGGCATSARASTTTTPAPIYREHSRRITPRDGRRATGSIRRSPAGRPTTSGAATAPTRSYGGASLTAFRRWLRAALRHARGPERGLGQRLLEPGVHRLGPDHPPHLTVGRAEPLARARFLPLRQRRRRRVPGGAGRASCASSRRAAGSRTTSCAFRRLRPLTRRRAASISPRGTPTRPGGSSARLSATTEKARWARTGHPDLISFNHDLYRGLQGPARLLGDGAGRGQINWARLQPAAGRRARWRSGRRRPTPTARVRQLLPLAGRHDGAGTDALRPAAPRRIARPRRRGGRGAGAAGARQCRGAAPAWRCCTTTRASGPTTRSRTAADASYWRQMMLFYGALRSLGVDVDIRHPDHDLSGYDLIVAPALQLMGAERARSPGRATPTATRTRLRAAHRLPHADRPRPRGRPAGSAARAARLHAAQLRRHAPGPDRRAGGHLVETWAEAYRPTTGDSARHLRRRPAGRAGRGRAPRQRASRSAPGAHP